VVGTTRFGCPLTRKLSFCLGDAGSLPVIDRKRSACPVSDRLALNWFFDPPAGAIWDANKSLLILICRRLSDQPIRLPDFDGFLDITVPADRIRSPQSELTGAHSTEERQSMHDEASGLELPKILI